LLNSKAFLLKNGIILKFISKIILSLSSDQAICFVELIVAGVLVLGKGIENIRFWTSINFSLCLLTILSFF